MMMVQQLNQFNQPQMYFMDLQCSNTLNLLLKSGYIDNQNLQQNSKQSKKQRPSVPKFDQPALKSKSLQEFENIQNSQEKQNTNKKFYILKESIEEVLIQLGQTDGKLLESCVQIIQWILTNNKDFFKNKKMIYLSATIIILSCFSNNIKLSIEKICKYLGVQQNIINIYLSSYKKKTTKISTHDRLNVQQKQKIITTSENTVLYNASKKLNLINQVETTGKYIYEQINSKKLCNGQSENVIAGCALSMACIISKQQLTCQNISEACEINEEDVKSLYEQLFPYRFHLLNNDISKTFLLQEKCLL